MAPRLVIPLLSRHQDASFSRIGGVSQGGWIPKAFRTARARVRGGSAVVGGYRRAPGFCALGVPEVFLGGRQFFSATDWHIPH